MNEQKKQATPPACRKLRDWLIEKQVDHKRAALMFGVTFRAFRGYLYGQRKPPMAFVIAVQDKAGILAEDWLPETDGRSNPLRRVLA